MEIPLSCFQKISLDQILPYRNNITWKENTFSAWKNKSFFNWNGKSFFSRYRFTNKFFGINYSSIEQEVKLDPNLCPSFITSVIGLCEKIEKLVLHRKFEPALELFEILCGLGTSEVGRSTYEALITACIAVKSPRTAELVFKKFIRSGINTDQHLMNRILVMHIKCGLISVARDLFDRMRMRNHGTWNAMIIGLVDSGYYHDAFCLFLTMWNQFSYGGSFTFTTCLRACAGLGFILLGRQLHSCIVKMGLAENMYISCALVDMYSKCGSIVDAKQVFYEMPEKTTIAWNSMIAAHALHGYSEEALDLYNKMQYSGVGMDQFTFSIVVKVSARLASISQAKEVHATLIRHGYKLDVVAGTTLMDLYCKWGRIEDAQYVFDAMQDKDIMTWNALLAGYGAHGRGEEAVRVFERMIRARVAPDHITFLAVLSACSRSGDSGLSEKAWEVFHSMESGYRVKPRAMHYTSMVELLGRDGQIDQAFSFIHDAPFLANANMWAALLTACRIHHRYELGKLAAERIFSLRPEKLCNYIVLLNIYDETGKKDQADNVLETMRTKDLSLIPRSWIEINKEAYVFSFGEPDGEICREVDEVWSEIERAGYVESDEDFLPDVVARERCARKWHSEILAVVSGMMKTGSFMALQVVQEHRVCGDCHSAIKFISMVRRREIVVKDASRFHHFIDGRCSCGDYW